MGNAERKVLNGWKEIAQYLGRGIRTVQRWERELQLPVHRPRGADNSAVVALGDELDGWLAKAPMKSSGFDEQAPGRAVSPIKARVLIVEDNLQDLRKCVSVLDRLGAERVDALSNVGAAMMRLENILEDKMAAPDLIILDLNFANESGFEVLRFWKSEPKLKQIPVLVWTQMGETEQKLCQYFGVRVIAKWAGTGELEEAVRLSAASQSA